MPDENDTKVTDLEFPNDLELHKNGTVTVHLEQGRIQLRRPKLGEFRPLREAFWEISEAVGDKSVELQAAKDSLRLELEAAGDTPEADLVRKIRAEDRRLGQELTTYGEDLYLEFFKQTVTKLATAGSLPDDDDLPPWVTKGATCAYLVNHWSAVPTPRGVK